MKKILFSLALTLLAVASCTFDEDQYVDFSNFNGDPSMFQVLSQKTTKCDNGFPDETTLPDGTPVNEYLASLKATKATNTTGAAWLANLLKMTMKDGVIEIAGTYQSKDEYGQPITLSGKVVLPVDQPIKNIILSSHYTIGSNAEAPSNTFPLDAQLATLGYALVCPDYIGYGVTGNRYHPYLMMDLTCHNVVDMLFAVQPFLKAIGREPLSDEIYLMGYSQGGGTTMGVQCVLETEHGPGSEKPVTIKRVFAGGGIYDLKLTFENFVETNTASYPCGVPFVLVGQIKGNHLDDALLDRLLRPEITAHMEEWFLYKTATTGQMNAIIGTKDTDKIMTETAIERTNQDMAYIYQLMTLNSVLSYSWTPQAPVYMMHSINDDTVPFANAAQAKVRWSNANIQYNFGEYGNHVVCCLRFIYTVKTLLENE